MDNEKTWYTGAQMAKLRRWSAAWKAAAKEYRKSWYNMSLENVTVERDDARRWAAAWKASAKDHRRDRIWWERSGREWGSISVEALDQRDDARRWARRMKAERDYLAEGVGEMQGYKLTGANDSDRPLIVSGQFEYRLPPVTLDEIAQNIVKRGIAEIKADLEGFDIPAAPDETTKPKPGDMVMMYAADGSYGGEFFVKELSLDTGEIKLMPYYQRQPDLGTVTDCKTDDDMTFITVDNMIDWPAGGAHEVWQIWHEGEE